MGKAGGSWVRAWRDVGGGRWLLKGTIRSVSLSLSFSVCLCHCPSCPLTLWFTLSTLHTRSGSFIFGMVCMCSWCVFFIL